MTVSICCITFNHAAFIDNCIKGFLMQQDVNIEIIIGDDCSTDNTQQLLKDYRDQYPELIRLHLNQTNLGIKENLLNVIKHCTGKYIAFCEGDDYWTDPYKLKKQVALLEENSACSITWTNFNILKGEALEINHFEVPYLNGLYQVTLDNFFTNYVTWTLTAVLRRDALDVAKLYQMKSVLDNTLYMMVLSSGTGFLLEDNTAVYRIHAGGVYSMKKEYGRGLMMLQNIRDIESHFPLLRKNAGFQVMKSGLFTKTFISFFREKKYKEIGDKDVRIFVKDIFSFSGLKCFFTILVKKISGR